MDRRDVIKQFIIQELLNSRKDVVLNNDDELLLSGLVDSLGVIRLITFLEAEWKTYIPPEDVTIEHFGTVAAIYDYLSKREPA